MSFTFVKIADTSGPYSSLGEPSINDTGTVAFLAGLDAAGPGIFTGPDPAADKVIRTGDPLFGSTVMSLDISESGAALNNFGRIAFWAELEDGTQGIYVANPEPTTMLLLGTGLAGLYGFRRKRFITGRGNS